MSDPIPQKKKRGDGQMSGIAAELFVAAELLKRGLQTSVTFGHAKGIDLLAHHVDNKISFTVQVKALRYGPNYFLIDPKKVGENHIYVFVILNGPEKAVEYSIVRGTDLIKDEIFNVPSDFPGIYSNCPLLVRSRNKWEIFQEKSSTNELSTVDQSSSTP